MSKNSAIGVNACAKYTDKFPQKILPITFNKRSVLLKQGVGCKRTETRLKYSHMLKWCMLDLLTLGCWDVKIQLDA